MNGATSLSCPQTCDVGHCNTPGSLSLSPYLLDRLLPVGLPCVYDSSCQADSEEASVTSPEPVPTVLNNGLLVFSPQSETFTL